MNDMKLPASPLESVRAELSARTGFAAGLFDRGAELRDDDGARAALEASPEARFAVVAGDKPVLKRTGAGFGVWHDRAELQALGQTEHAVFLGREGAAGRFGVRIAAAQADVLKERADVLVLDLRSLAIQGLVPPDELGAIGEAKAMTDWHARHTFCANCGAPTVSASGGWKRECDSCKAQHFPRTDPVTIMLVVRGDKCLLARQSRFPLGMLSCIAGFVEPGETIEDAVRRETLEETGLIAGEVRYLCSQPWPFPSSLMIGCIATSLTDEITLDRTELEEGRWFSRDEVRAMLRGQHPEGFSAPIKVAIANTLMRAWVDG